jgi:hypothetical protein
MGKTLSYSRPQIKLMREVEVQDLLNSSGNFAIFAAILVPRLW